MQSLMFFIISSKNYCRVRNVSWSENFAYVLTG